LTVLRVYLEALPQFDLEHALLVHEGRVIAAGGFAAPNIKLFFHSGAVKEHRQS
jgi:hypothetical protein